MSRFDISVNVNIDDSHRLTLACPSCSWWQVCDLPAMVDRLRDLRMLLREADPSSDLVLELFQAAAQRMACSVCNRGGLVARAPTAGELQRRRDDFDEHGWSDSVACSRCGQRIASERLAVFPDTNLCTACQAQRELGGGEDPIQYCPRCGSAMHVASGGKKDQLTRYVWRCTQCRYVDKGKP